MFEKPKSRFTSIEKLPENQKQEALNWVKQKIKQSATAPPTIQEQITDIELALVEIYEVMLNG